MATKTHTTDTITLDDRQQSSVKLNVVTGKNIKAFTTARILTPQLKYFVPTKTPVKIRNGRHLRKCIRRFYPSTASDFIIHINSFTKATRAARDVITQFRPWVSGDAFAEYFRNNCTLPKNQFNEVEQLLEVARVSSDRLLYLIENSTPCLSGNMSIYNRRNMITKQAVSFIKTEACLIRTCLSSALNRPDLTPDVDMLFANNSLRLFHFQGKKQSCGTAR
jgi:hypothetical protein